MDYAEIFNDSYERVIRPKVDPKDFFGRFYENFVAKSPLVAEKFKNTDMEKQKKMLKDSMIYLLNFYVNKSSSGYMDKVADVHGRKQHNIEPALYDVWMDSLVETLKELDSGFNPDVELAWRIILSPGITYMKFNYSRN